MRSGTLQVDGVLSVNQLWPAGESDADTLTLQTATEEPFSFRAGPEAEFRVTRVFESAWVVGRVRKKVLREGKLTVRLQGADSPELHFAPTALLRADRRSPEQAA